MLLQPLLGPSPGDVISRHDSKIREFPTHDRKSPDTSVVHLGNLLAQTIRPRNCRTRRSFSGVSSWISLMYADRIIGPTRTMPRARARRSGIWLYPPYQ